VRHRTTRRGAAYLAAVALSLGATPKGSAGQDTLARSAEVRKLADAYFAPLVASRRASVAAVIVTDRAHPIFSAAYGPVDLQRTTWRAASVSKVLTAIAVMRLVEQGKIDLDTDVNRYLTTLQVPSTFHEPITLRQLVELRSGLDDRFVGDGFKNGEQPSMRSLMARVLPSHDSRAESRTSRTL